MAPRETENNAYAKFWGDKQRALWYVMVFLEWSILPIVYFGSGEALISNNTLCLASSGPTSILGHDKVSRQPSG